MKQYLIITFILSYLSFGIIVISNTTFVDIFSNPMHILLLTLGFLGPLISTLILHMVYKGELGGFNSFIDNFKVNKSKYSIITVFALLATHYGLASILQIVDSYGEIIDFFKYFPIMILFLGSQEIGWRGIVQPYYEKEKGYYKSIIITGLFWAIWFLPLTYIRGFYISPNFYVQFASYLIGLSFLLTSMYKVSKSFLYPILLSGLIFSLVPVIVFKLGSMLIGLAAIEGLVASFFKERDFQTKNT